MCADPQLICDLAGITMNTLINVRNLGYVEEWFELQLVMVCDVVGSAVGSWVWNFKFDRLILALYGGAIPQLILSAPRWGRRRQTDLTASDLFVFLRISDYLAAPTHSERKTDSAQIGSVPPDKAAIDLGPHL
eukprot:sb/3474860/